MISHRNRIIISLERLASVAVILATAACATTSPNGNNSGTIAPVLTREVDPVYPEDAYWAKLEGQVDMLLSIDAEGRVVDVKVIKATDKIFIGSAVFAARNYRFEPQKIDGVPQPSKVQLSLCFSLDHIYVKNW